MGFILKQNSPKSIGPAGNTNTTWNDSMQPGLTIKLGASAPGFEAFLGAGNLLAYTFDGVNTTEQFYFSLQFPHHYKMGTTIYPHVHWCPTTADAGNVKWKLEYSWASIGTAFGAVATISGIGAAAGTAWTHSITQLTPIDGTNKGISSIIVGRVYRDPTDGEDTYAHDVSLLGFDCHFEMDTFGSLEETSKL